MPEAPGLRPRFSGMEGSLGSSAGFPSPEIVHALQVQRHGVDLCVEFETFSLPI